MKNLCYVLELENHVRKQLCSKKSNATYIDYIYTKKEILRNYCSIETGIADYHFLISTMLLITCVARDQQSVCIVDPIKF